MKNWEASASLFCLTFALFVTLPFLSELCFGKAIDHANNQYVLRYFHQDVFDDHAPPHFHVEYAEFKAVVDIQNLELSEGSLPRRAQMLVMDWAELHQQELIEDWNLCAAKQPPKSIRPLL